jgi:hypothetical protein
VGTSLSCAGAFDDDLARAEPAARGKAVRRGATHFFAMVFTPALRRPEVGFGRIVVSEIGAPALLANVV